MTDAASSDPRVRTATPADAPTIGRMLHEFNSEFGDFTPGAEFLGRRLGRLIDEDEVHALLAGDGPDGFLTMRFFPAVLSASRDAYVEELYIAPNTGETDEAARSLYESLGYTNLEGGPGGPRMLYYEREL